MAICLCYILQVTTRARFERAHFDILKIRHIGLREKWLTEEDAKAVDAAAMALQEILLRSIPDEKESASQANIDSEFED